MKAKVEQVREAIKTIDKFGYDEDIQGALDILIAAAQQPVQEVTVEELEEWRLARSGDISWNRLAEAEHGLVKALAQYHATKLNNEEGELK